MFAERLKELRKEKKITQVQLAEMLDVSTKKNETKNISTLTVIAKELNSKIEKKNEIVKVKEKEKKS